MQWSFTACIHARYGVWRAVLLETPPKCNIFCGFDIQSSCTDSWRPWRYTSCGVAVLGLWQRFMELFITAFDKSEITTIQALIIMASPLFTRCDERSLSWLYSGIAFNMIIDLGMHTDVGFV
jgi:hypothetical protein